MKTKTIILSAAIILMMTACNNSGKKSEPANNNSSQIFNLDTMKLASGTMYYHCEMHPQVISDMPGNCPKCGMELMEMKKN